MSLTIVVATIFGHTPLITPLIVAEHYASDSMAARHFPMSSVNCTNTGTANVIFTPDLLVMRLADSYQVIDRHFHVHMLIQLSDVE